MNEAQDFAEEDKKRKEAVEARNNADSLIYQTEKTLKDLAGKVDQGDVDKIEKAKQELKDTLEKDDTEAIKAKTEALSEAVYAMTTKMYQQASAEKDEHDVGPDDDENVVDADFDVNE